MTSQWLLLVSHLPSRERTPRMRLWRSLRALGAALLRDGVYVLPQRDGAGEALDEQASAVRVAGGSAHVLACEPVDASDQPRLRALFDRDDAYGEWRSDAADLFARIATLDESPARRREAALRRALDDIVRKDFFPGAARTGAVAEMEALAAALNARYSPDEPVAREGVVERRRVEDFRARIWATRRGLWVDRVASAWLIRRCIDPRARFAWLDTPADCPADAVGFDFDDAEFSHVGERVTFEVLAAAFGLDAEAPLRRIGALVRYLDVGGTPAPEAAGVLALLGGARERCPDDDAFLDAASVLLDDLRAAFSSPAGTRT